MIIFRAKGGLGNQLFQYAFSRKISLLQNQQLKIDTSYFSNNFGYVQRNFILDKFNINADIASKKDISQINFLTRIPTLNNKFCEFFSKEGKYWGKYIVEGQVSYGKYNENALNLKSQSGFLIEGYWQSYLYFQDIQGILKSELTLKENYSSRIRVFLEKVKIPNSVCIHIRRGDYISLNWNTDIKYYSRAIEEIEKSINNPTFFVFSDDIEWVKKNVKFGNHEVIFVSEENFEDFEEFSLMRYCSHQIISNSTFSWWAAFLNENEQKIVISPSIWIDNINTNEMQIIPNEWHIM